MAIVNLFVAAFDDNSVVISVDYDDVTLTLETIHWDNTSGSPYSVDWGNRHFSIPVGSGSLGIPGNRKLISLGVYDDGSPILRWGDTVRIGRG